MKQLKTIKSGKLEHELSLLNSKALISLLYYLDYREYENARESLNVVFSQYKYNYDDVIAAIKKSFFYITKHRYEMTEGVSRLKPRPSKEAIDVLKSDMNEFIKKYKHKSTARAESAT